MGRGQGSTYRAKNAYPRETIARPRPLRDLARPLPVCRCRVGLQRRAHSTHSATEVRSAAAPFESGPVLSKR